ncbi:solute carrier family 49 member 4 homolog isoform X1 [Haliotis rufescens]|uniref:solute carrier family 49 member 4 homolog isoform X1 n=1 Tax=Haliotis rufescens TaxID=6454 RepID=UPI00201FA00C|nr:solute carrier family 49 member 4 homolog isoform X1 [Haliotis rufescens]XP_048238119.1 solute carrier family 49 member 4 homolog isoform X1 [Haliotis rufescens]
MADVKTPLLADQEDLSYSSIGEPCTVNPDRKHSESSIDIKTSASAQGDVTKDDVKVKLYKRRWYMLVIFSLMSGTQSFVWNTWAPISNSSEVAFGWNDAVISLMANWGPITFFIGMPLFAWMLDMKGLRISSLLSMFMIAAGCGIRCITTSPPWVTWTMHIGQFLNGLAGPVGTGGPPSMSATWFPPNERTTATALATIIKFLMVACSFVIGPQLVPEVHTKNCTLDNFTMSSSPASQFEEFHLEHGCMNGTNVTVPTVAKLREDIMFLMYVECGWSVGLFLIMLLYFPNKPPHPPCVSASVKRESFKQGVMDLLRRRQFWVLALVFCLAGGGSTAWTGVLKVNMKPTGISQDQAGWIGFYTFFASCAAMLVVARLVDLFSRYMKWFISGVYFIAAAFFAWFAVICTGVLPATLPVLYVSVMTGQTALTTAIPIVYEMGCELTYPIGEGTANIAMTLMNNVGALIFLLVLMIPNIGTVWMNWALVGAIGLSIPMVLMIRETHPRLDIDETKVVEKD